MAAVVALRGGLRGALVAQQQRAWSSGSGADQVGAAGRGGGGLEAAGVSRPPSPHRCLSSQLGELGKGAGKGGGGGGAIREAGGAFGKKQAAEEERYFR